MYLCSPFAPDRTVWSGNCERRRAEIFLKIFEKDLEECKKFLPLQPASETEPVH